MWCGGGRGFLPGIMLYRTIIEKCKDNTILHEFHTVVECENNKSIGKYKQMRRLQSYSFN